MTTLNDLLYSIFRGLGVLATGETPEAAMMVDGQTTLNFWLEAQSATGTFIYAATRESFPLVAAQASYTMGASGNFNTVRPKRFTNQFIRDTDSNDYPLEIIDENRYDSILSKSVSGRPYYMYPLFGSPLVTLYMYPVPDAVYTLYLDSEKQLSDITSFTTALTIPTEYLNCIKWNVMCEMAPEFGKEPTPFQLSQAEKYLSIVKNLNAANRMEPTRLDLFPKPGGIYYDINSDTTI